MIGKIKNFCKTPSKNPKIVVIYGPTACGKTRMSLDVANQLQSEIISVDSRQIYTGMDIGTGKIQAQEMQGIPHHLLDIIDPDKEYSVGQFQKDAMKALGHIYSKGKIPILCGGTGLYIDSIIYDFEVPKVPSDVSLRKSLEAEATLYGAMFVYKKLEQIDPEYAKYVHPHNTQYVIRGIEVKILTGKSKLNFRKEKKLRYDTLFLTPYGGDRKILYKNIDTRVLSMFEQGLVDEVEALVKKYTKNAPGLEAIGYSEVIDYLEGKLSLEECISQVQQNSRNYAKRQLTWFSKYVSTQQLG